MAVVVGLDVGGTKTNATVLTDDGRFLVDHMVEVPSRVLEGPAAAIAAIDEAMELVLDVTATRRAHGARRRARHARTGQRRWRDLGAGATNFAAASGGASTSAPPSRNVCAFR